jgi:hypothetical protein
MLIAVPSAVRSQSWDPPADAGRFTLYIHAGTKGIAQPPERLVGKIIAMLADRGYLVRRPDTERDEEDGPGVDYFDPHDLPAAADIAKVVGTVGDIQLKPRLKRGGRGPGYIDLWLFGAPPP